MVIALNCGERRLLAPLAIDQPKGPVLDLKPALSGELQRIPVIGPGKNHRPRGSPLEACLHLPGESLGLDSRAFPHRVNAKLGED